MEKTDLNHTNNVYAKNIKGSIVHVTEVESGRKGYYCLGCNREMQAVKPKVANRIAYFRHDPKFVDKGKPCAYSDETYRHKLAKEILIREKRIKLPNLYKYPPKGTEGSAMILNEARFLDAATAIPEIFFYEDENGEIKHSKGPPSGNHFLLIKPDITFFDEEGMPILLIEVVATHKVPPEKRRKIRFLGIDTIQVRIPRASPSEIEQLFKRTSHTKWIYSHEEANTEYVRVSPVDSNTVLEFDEQQRDLFEENFNCRAAEIRNLIRAIGKCLESQPYRNFAEYLGSEISRVEENTERHQDEWNSIENRIRTEIYKQHGARRKGIDERRKRLKAKDRNLEERYLRKRIELETAIGSVGDELERAATKDIRFEIRAIESEIQRIENDIKEAEEEIESIERKGGTIPERFAKKEREIGEGIEFAEERERREIDKIESEQRELSAAFETDREGLGQRFGNLRERTIEAITNRDVEGATRLSGNIARTIRGWRDVIYSCESQPDLRRIKEAQSALGDGSYKSWIDI
ncbi:MAG: hypothetical protein AAF570_03110 [Bacteroidota bacterium]